MSLYGRLALTLIAATLMSGCQQKRVEVSDPFYLDYIENPRAIELRRCGNGCSAVEGLPSANIDGTGPYVVAAGANKRFIAIEQKAIGRDDEASSYYYFARIPDEAIGWGKNPEKIIGPLDEVQFAIAKKRLGLPDLTIKY